MLGLGRKIDLGNPVSDHPLNNGLLSWWLPLPNNSGGSKLFDLCNRNHGTLVNGATWSNDNWRGFGSIKHIRTSSTRVAVGSIAFPAAGSLIWSQYPTEAHDTGTTRTMWGEDGIGFGAQLFTDNNWYVGWESGNRVILAASSSNWVINKWNWYAYTWGASSNELYHNGSQIGSNGSTTSKTLSFLLGTYKYTSFASFPGFQDCYRLLGRQRSAAQIAAEYDQWQRGYPDLLRRIPSQVWSFGSSGGGGSQTGTSQVASVTVSAIQGTAQATGTVTRTPNVASISLSETSPGVSGQGTVTATIGDSTLAGIEAYYRFDGNGTDSSGNSRNLSGFPTYNSSGIANQCLLSGTVSRTGFGVTNGNPFTVGYWVKYVGEAGGLTAAQFGEADRTDALLVDTDNSGFYVSATFGGSTVVDYTVNPIWGTWVHVVLTYDGTTARLYVDGVLRSSAATSAGSWFSNAMAYSASMDAVCAVDEGVVYSRALDDNTVAALWNGGAAHDPTIHQGATLVHISATSPVASATGTVTVTENTAAVTISAIDPVASGSGTTTTAPQIATVTLSAVDSTATATGTVTLTANAATVTISAIDVFATSPQTAVANAANATITAFSVAATGTNTATATSNTATVTVSAISSTVTASGTVSVVSNVATVTITAFESSAVAGGSIGYTETATVTISETSPTVSVSGTASITPDVGLVSVISVNVTASQGGTVIVYPNVSTITVSSTQPTANPTGSVGLTPTSCVVTLTSFDASGSNSGAAVAIAQNAIVNILEQSPEALGTGTGIAVPSACAVSITGVSVLARFAEVPGGPVLATVTFQPSVLAQSTFTS